jgi:hypothetical protein
MNLPPPKVCQRIRKLHALLSSDKEHEREAARVKLAALLAEWNLAWIDLPDIFAAASVHASSAPPSPPQAGPTDKPEINVLDLVLRLIEYHIAVTPAERMAVALWILHCWVFDRFTITPRLIPISPVRGCGKTTLVALIELLTPEPCRTDNTTAAAIYYLLDRRPNTTLLVDEGDNLDLFRNSTLRTVFNSGHRRGGVISRFVGGWSRQFPTFAPLCVAAIGTLPLPLMHRAVVINMQRASGELQRPDEHDPSFRAAREQIRRWMATCSLAPDPEMPPLLRNRAADNWRVLISVADSLAHGEDARAAAMELCANRPDEDPGVTLLVDIRGVFLAFGVDRITSVALVEALVSLDDGFWHEWRGVSDDRPPRKLTQSELARLLRPFGIRPKTIWPAQRRPGDKSKRGYARTQFEAAWRAYTPAASTPTQAGRIIGLRRP